jgi:hypothetical protein
MTRRVCLPLLALVASAAACSGAIPGARRTDPPPPAGSPPDKPASPPFEPLPPRAYASKVKDLLTGLPLTDDELRVVSTDSRALRPLIDGWMTLPSFHDKMLDFFKKAFQQTQIDVADLEEQISPGTSVPPSTNQKRLLATVEESFPRTVLALIDEKRPFTETVTTTRFMMNLPMMVALAFMDAAPKDDLGRPLEAGYWHLKKFGATNFKLVLTRNVDPTTGLPAPIPFEETVDPASPHFMTLTFTPGVGPNSACVDPVVLTGGNAVRFMFRALFGSRGPGCIAAQEPSLFTEDDWNTWRMVTVRAPRAGEERTTFWELPKLRDPKTTELVLATPRVGFFTTPAFLANWPTNQSNSYRVTMNQALIVALGRSFDDRNTTVQVSETSVDALHVQPGTVCYGCHIVLDPMRDFFKQSYSLTYFEQLSALNPSNPPLPAQAVFSLDGVDVRGTGVATLARAMAKHPAFATGWTHKLCQLANAESCDETDPEFMRVAGVFRASNHDFKTLLLELFSSPLVTYDARTKTADATGVVMSIARRDAYCARLSVRLGFKDVCNLQGETSLPGATGRLRTLVLGIPGSSYARADERPVMPHDPNPFSAAALEQICQVLAGQVVDGTPRFTLWKATARDVAIADFVAKLMGVPPSDPLSSRLVDALQRHYASAIAAQAKPADALRSSFTVACSSSLATSMSL